MTDRIVGVRFHEAGPSSYYDGGDLEIQVGQYVVVETARGLEIARVVVAPDQVIANDIEGPLKPVLRLATEEDLATQDELKRQASEALERARRKAEDMGLPMKVADARYTLDGRALIYSFTAERRFDYKELGRQLASELGTRIRFDQIGARDQAKLLDGLGICGQRLCCSRWLLDFPAVAMRMAKEQNLSPNPDKLSGLCGKLRCCLAYEEPTYRELRANLPRRGTPARVQAGQGRVVGSNILKQTVLLELETKAVIEVPLEEIEVGAAPPSYPQPPTPPLVEEIQPPADELAGGGNVATADAEAPASEAAPTPEGEGEAAGGQRSGRRRRRRRRRRGSGGNSP